MPDDDDLGGVGVVLGEVGKRRRAVDEAVVLDGQPGRVLAGDVAEVRVTGAGGHEDEAVVAERVVGAGEVEDPALLRRILAVDAPVVIRLPAGGAEAGERAGLGVETGAAAVEKEHDLRRVGPALPEGELAAVGTLAVAARNDLLPLLIGGRGRGVGAVVATAPHHRRCRRTRQPWSPTRQDEKQGQDPGAVAGHSIAGRAMAGGWRPARSQPAAAAASGTPTTRSTRGSTGIRPR